MAAVHTLSMCAVVIALIEVAALTISFVPFTHAYPPGHANLKSLWWIYVFGLVVFAYWPARIAVSSIESPTSLLEMTAGLAVAIGLLDIVGRRRTSRESFQEDDDQEDDRHSATVLDIGAVINATVSTDEAQTRELRSRRLSDNHST
jgi:hypothetical protein